MGVAACERHPASRGAHRDTAPYDATLHDTAAHEVAAPETEDDYPVAPSPLEDVEVATLRALDGASTRVAEALWPALRDGPGNPQWSPAMAVASLGVIAAMARPAVARRVYSFLGLQGERPTLDQTLAALLRSWSRFPGTPGFAALLRPFVARGARLDADARARLRSPYATPAALVAAQGNEGVRARIHQFFHARTDGAVTLLVAFDGIVPDAPANVLTIAGAALRVRGVRAVGSFRVGGVVAIDVEAAVVHEGASIARSVDASVLRVPLTDPTLLFEVLLPDEGARLDAVEPRALTALFEHTRAMAPVRGAVVLPTLDTAPVEATRLRNALWNAGLAEPFDPEGAPLAMSGLPRGWVSELFHFVRVSLTADETPGGTTGTTAIAVNRPFAWTLRDARHGALLALGRVFDPRE